MRHLTRISRLAALPLAATLLVACGGGESDSSADSGAESSESAEADETSDYCADLEDAASTLESFGGSDTEAAEVEQFFTTMHELAAVAPSEIEPQWQQVDGAITSLEDSLEQAGLEIEDFAELQQSQQLPEGVTQQDLQPVLSAAQEFSSEENSAAFEEIDQHGREECDVDLGGNGEDPTESPSDEPTS